jgi:septum formation protein
VEATPGALAVAHARGKAAAVARTRPGRLVLGVDTVVVVDGAAWGKPADEAEARAMLRALAGRDHVVASGLCLRRGDEQAVRLAETVVRFAAPDPGRLERYLASGEWVGRAGGYAIQGRGAALVDAVDGDFWNVVGLPVPALRSALAELDGPEL